jgi:hypothetical protein
MLYELHYWWRSSRDYRYPSQEKEQ